MGEGFFDSNYRINAPTSERIAELIRETRQSTRSEDSRDIKIKELSEENEKLKKIRAEYEKGIKVLIDAYEKLDAEYKKLKDNLKKKERKTVRINNIMNFFQKIGSDFNKWLHS